MAIKIGITGGIGSGKSMVSRLLEVLGVPVYISDLETKKLMVSDSFIREELSALLGVIKKTLPPAASFFRLSKSIPF